MNTRALRRNQRAAAEATAAAESLLLGELRGPPNGSDVSPAREGSNAEEEAGGEGGGEEQPHPTTADEIDGEGLREVEESDGPETEMLQMEAVAHLGRADRLGIIRKTVPFEKRVLALQRLFFLAQGRSCCFYALLVAAAVLVVLLKCLRDASLSRGDPSTR